MKKNCFILVLLLTMAVFAIAQETNEQRPVSSRQAAVNPPALYTPPPAASGIAKTRDTIPVSPQSERAVDLAISETAPEPETEFQQLVHESLGHPLPIFGRE